MSIVKQFRTFAARENSTGLLPFSRRRVMPLHALSFRFWVEMMEPAFVTNHEVEQEVIALGIMSSKELS
jgi:hypothetical protein